MPQQLAPQPQHNAKAARRFLKRLITRFGEPLVTVTDRLHSYCKPIRKLAPNADHRAHNGLKNRNEGSHRPTRRREKVMSRFKSPGQAQRFHAAHDLPHPTLSDLRNLLSPRQGRCFRPLDYLCSGNCRLRTRRFALRKHAKTSWLCPCATYRTSIFKHRRVCLVNATVPCR